MPKLYERAEFALPKVSGLAIHNAQLTRTRLEAEEHDAAELRDDLNNKPVLNPELMPYALYIVEPDCSVTCVAGEATSADFQRMVSKGNLRLLADKYKAIGFVTCNIPWGKKATAKSWDAVLVPKQTK